MGHPKGFLDHKRQTPGHRPVDERIHDYNEMDIPLTPDQISDQAKRCMDCGIPFCHGYGCPVDNCIPEIHGFIKTPQHFGRMYGVAVERICWRPAR